MAELHRRRVGMAPYRLDLSTEKTPLFPVPLLAHTEIKSSD